MKTFKAILLLIFLISSEAFALGVKAGTVITNQATLSYEQDDETYEILSNETRDIVDQLIDVSLHWLDEKVVVKNGAENVVCSFKLTNTGNGEDSFYINATKSDDSQITLLNKQIFIDTNHNSKWDASDLGSANVTLKADESVIVFVHANVPTVDLRRNQFANIDLYANSKRGGSGTPGYVHVAQGIEGLDAIDGKSGGIAIKKAQIVVIDLLKPTIIKSIKVENSHGTNEPVTDAILYIELDVYLSNGGKVEDFKLSDVIPANTIYMDDSITVNGKSLSDKIDSDAVYFDMKNNSIKLNLMQFSYPETLKLIYRVKVL